MYKRKIKRKLIILVIDLALQKIHLFLEKKKRSTFSISLSLFLDQEVVWSEDVRLRGKKESGDQGWRPGSTTKQMSDPGNHN